MGVFQLYSQEKGQSTDFASFPMPILNDLLKKFYVETRRKDKQPYSKSSLTAIRFGLCRFIKSSRPDVDIINGSEFNEANRVLKAKVVEFLKKQGKAKVEHKPAIAKEDLKNCTKVWHLTLQHPQVCRIKFGLR